MIAPVFTTLKLLAYPVGSLVSAVLLMIIYFAAITPVGVILRRFHDPMERAFRRDAGSYWTKRQASSPERYLRQF